MSGHSKWHNIQDKKGKKDQARSNLFTKLNRAVTLAAQQGSGDVDMNFALRLAVERAKAANVPKDNIDKAIKRGTGELADTARMEAVLYEGFGPSGIAFLIDAVTDNKNRTVSEIKHVLSLFGGSLGGPGAVQWQFVHKGVARISSDHINKLGDRKADFELALMDAQADDIKESAEGWTISTGKDHLQLLVDAVNKFGIECDSSNLEWIPKERIVVGPETLQKISNVSDALESLDDVREVFSNVVQ
ncbi:MAG: YebC/PmpR family DNA-binding transcriptional regulator [Candidatus Magasanikbacteria bacterium]|nr:YebC/PmpR family DNA-binding transcriptional regulator [Candidatus Magasanikbacteria bacterium]